MILFLGLSERVCSLRQFYFYYQSTCFSHVVANFIEWCGFSLAGVSGRVAMRILRSCYCYLIFLAINTVNKTQLCSCYRVKNICCKFWCTTRECLCMICLPLYVIRILVQCLDNFSKELSYLYICPWSELYEVIILLITEHGKYREILLAGITK